MPCNASVSTVGVCASQLTSELVAARVKSRPGHRRNDAGKIRPAADAERCHAADRLDMAPDHRRRRGYGAQHKIRNSLNDAAPNALKMFAEGDAQTRKARMESLVRLSNALRKQRGLNRQDKG